MSDSPFVSILMPVYNAGDFLAQAIDSVLAQTHTNFELLCIDDGSTDNSAAIVREHTKKDSRISLYVNRENVGVIATRNLLLEKARGEYVAWIDSDDYLAPDKIRLQLEYLSKRPLVGAIGTGIAYVTKTGAIYKEELFTPDPEKQRWDPSICCATVLVRREAVDAAGGFRPAFRRGGEDGDWLLRIGDKWQITNIPEVLYFYRKNPGSLSHAHRSEIRRLGVIARYAARVRRRTGTCPIDNGDIGEGPGFLCDEWFLENPNLTPLEKVTGLSFPLPGAPPLVSVVVPYYKEWTYFCQTLASLARSTFENFEVCIYDDASPTDLRTLLTAEQRANYFFPIQAQRGEENHGPAYARNRVLEKCRGRFWMFQDCDDLSAPNRISRQLEHLLANRDCAAVGSAVDFVSLDGEPVRSETFPREAVGPAGFHGCCATFMVRADTAGSVRFNETLRSSSEDVDYLLRVAEFGNVQNISDRLYSYRTHEQSLTSRVAWQADHAAFMINHVAKKTGAINDEGEINLGAFVPFVISLDGTQTGDLVLVHQWRLWRSKHIGVRRLLRTFLLLPKSGGRAFARKLSLHTSVVRRRVRLIVGRAYGLLRSRLEKQFAGGRKMLRRITHVLRMPSADRQIIVRVYDNWGDAEEALDMLLPNADRMWGNVRYTTARHAFTRPDYHLVLNHPGRKPVPIRAAPERIIFAIGEPPTINHRPLHRGQGSGTVVFTCEPEVEAEFGCERSYVIGPCMTRTWSVKKTFNELLVHDEVYKTKTLSWITSNLALLPGHRRRLEFLERLRKEVPFDLFGRGFQEIGDKWHALAPYKYSIAYENTISDYYFTEKLMDCLVAQAVPLYVGSPKIQKLFPAQAIIPIDPNDPRVIYRILDVINFDDWEARRAALLEAKHLVLTKYNMFIRIAEWVTRDVRVRKRSQTTIVRPVEVNWGIGQ
jgi:glycosyltransferase involved in cell wall biosynthesis